MKLESTRGKSQLFHTTLSLNTVLFWSVDTSVRLGPYLDWGRSEPRDSPIRECLALRNGTLRWFNEDCSARLPFICVVGEEGWVGRGGKGGVGCSGVEWGRRCGVEWGGVGEAV